MGDAIQIKNLQIYPIKSCGSIPLASALITSIGLASPSGILKDRQWVIKRGDSIKFITQRQQSSLALVQPRIEPAEALLEGSTIPVEAITMVLSAPGMPDLRIPLAHTKDKTPVEVEVWAWQGMAYDEGTAAAEWFSKYLGRPAMLVRYGGDTATAPDAGFQRGVSTEWAPEGHQIAFADQFPYLMGNEASLENLNSLVPGNETIPMNRFRPNIVIDGPGAGPWDEDLWADVRFGGEKGALLRNVKPCSRCKVPTIDQATGVEGQEPIRTMYQVRSGEVLGWLQPSWFKNTVFFGSNMCLIEGEGTVVRCREQIQVISKLTEPLKPRNV